MGQTHQKEHKFLETKNSEPSGIWSSGKYVAQRTGVKFRASDFLREAFLPVGYPNSVSPDYLDYQRWDTCQALCSAVTGMLATRAVLQGVGVGESSATPTAAALSWALRDGIGMISRVSFAWFHGTDLDCNAKTYRFLADVLNDLAMAFDIISPLFPRFFVLLACVGSTMRALVGIYGGATRAAVTVHQARQDNAADVQAKDGSQETAVSLIGLLLGMIVTPLVGSSQLRVWSLFIAFVYLHLYANWRCVTSIQFDSINRNRLNILVDEYLMTSHERALSIKDVSRREGVFYFESLKRFKVILGSRVSDILKGTSWHDFELALKRNEAEKHILFLHKRESRWTSAPRYTIHILLKADASSDEIHFAYFHATMCRYRMASGGQEPTSDEARKVFGPFLQKLRESGWRVENMRLGETGWRLDVAKEL